MLQREFKLEHDYYVLFYADHEFSFWIDSTRSDAPLRLVDKESSFGFSYYDEIPERVVTATHTSGPHLFTLMREIRSFIQNFIRAEKPYFWYFVASSYSRLAVYHRFAEKIAKKYGYHLEVDEENAKFSFIRIDRADWID